MTPQSQIAAPPIVPTSTTAILGLIFAVLIAPLGLAISIAARRETKTGQRAGHGLAIAGIVIGAIGSAFWLVLIASIVMNLMYR